MKSVRTAAVGFAIILCLGAAPKTVVIDSLVPLEQALSGREIPAKITEKLEIVDVRYMSFDGQEHLGQLVVNKAVAKAVTEVFAEIYAQKFPIKSCIPVNKFGWDDDKSMAANNTSAFNYRFIAKSSVPSKHAQGLAIDINPLQNPQIKRGKVTPAGAAHDPKVAGTLFAGTFIPVAFRKHGFTWGGNWRNHGIKDYMHFEKTFWR